MKDVMYTILHTYIRMPPQFSSTTKLHRHRRHLLYLNMQLIRIICILYIHRSFSFTYGINQPSSDGFVRLHKILKEERNSLNTIAVVVSFMLKLALLPYIWKEMCRIHLAFFSYSSFLLKWTGQCYTYFALVRRLRVINGGLSFTKMKLVS